MIYLLFKALSSEATNFWAWDGLIFEIVRCPFLIVSLYELWFMGQSGMAKQYRTVVDEIIKMTERYPMQTTYCSANNNKKM